jgi:hypothetical protein
MSVMMMMWMIIGPIGGVMRTPGAKQCTGKEKQFQFSFPQHEQNGSIHK